MKLFRKISHSFVLLTSILGCLTAAADDVVPAEAFLEVFGISDEDLKRDILVEKLPRVTITIHFETDSAEIDGRHNIKQLEQLGKALQSNKLKRRRFSIEGHTDSRGSNAHNMTLSVLRSEAVVDYLVEKFSIGRDNLDANGQGEYFPLDDGDSPEAHAKNRRVEIVMDGILTE